jgi:uncharacterized membrane protein
MELPSLIFLGIAITGLLVTWVSSSSKLDPNEPPEVLSSVPIVGHIAGLIKRTFHYNVDLALQNRSKPIFTIRFLGQKFYVITSVDLMLAVQKQYKFVYLDVPVMTVADRVQGTVFQDSRSRIQWRCGWLRLGIHAYIEDQPQQ